LIAHRGGRSIGIESADVFFEHLERLVDVQAELQRPNRRSTELLVASVKKYLRAAEYRIQLDDLFGAEIRGLKQRLAGKEYSADARSLTEQHFITTVARYESATEPLARMFGVLGRWGTGTEVDFALETIARFAKRESLGGFVVLLGLRTYPAVLLLYCYGLGLLKARRYGVLFRLFSANIRTDYGKQTPLVQHLYLAAWEGMQEEKWWKSFPGYEQRRTALSDHLHDILGPWTNDYVFMSGEFTQLYEEFEMMATLAYLSQTANIQSLQGSVKPDHWGKNFVWAPLGRISWDRENRASVLATFEDEAKVKLVLEAGFARGDPTYFQEALSNLQRMFDRIF
jgi:hypothetical protein